MARPTKPPLRTRSTGK
ncbi:hypothetical protein Egran_03536 [Elaphomyces granulatus]|uniref:Uncharacterized protein n=1 Tax=Elaphomyces granulatus TaxID=519963 RepID=A0A232LX04_9EURO|nr:hypothetical protein Egran_03536 [Elaphomyces granulatus]